MSGRERKLAWGLGAAAVIFAVIVFATTGSSRVKGLFSENERLRERSAELRALIDDHDFWAQRDAWLDENVPRFASRQEASSALLEAVEALANKTGGESEQGSIVLKSRQLTEPPSYDDDDDGAANDYFDSTSMKMEVEASEADLYQWIHRLQEPDTFRGVTALTLERGATGNGTLHAEIELTQFYLP